MTIKDRVFPNRSIQNIILFVVVFGITGVVLLLAIRASSYSVAVEAELASSGLQPISDATASNSYIEFGQGSTGDNNTNGPIGFGQDATGGSESCVVSSLSASELESCAFAGGKYVTFSVSGTINISRFKVASNTTIDGVGQDITLSGGGVQIKDVQNIIIKNLTHVGASDDAIEVQNGHDIWFDHLDMSDSVDGLIDITRGSTGITISWSHFHNHNKISRINTETGGTVYGRQSVTIHHNWFENFERRNPSTEYTDLHMFNNYTDNWDMYAVKVTNTAILLSENNVFENCGGDVAIILTDSPDTDGDALVRGDLSSCGYEESGVGFIPPYSYNLDPVDTVVTTVTTKTGPNK